MTISLPQLNTCDQAAFVAALSGVYEHSPWIAQRAIAQRPFKSLNALKQALQASVRAATPDEQLGLMRAHPELAGKAAIGGALTEASNSEQTQTGLTTCSAEEFATLHQLNRDYNAKFGFPFILAVKGPDGKGLARQTIISTFQRRLQHLIVDEQDECLRQIHRIAELRLNDLFGNDLLFGSTIMAGADVLAQWSDETTGLTCAYMTEAHCKSAAQLALWMSDAGMQVAIDAVGNVVGRYISDAPRAKTLITGSHYDTVRNGGKYDGREGILLPIAIVNYLHQRGERLPYHLEVIAFAEEEGVRFKSTFLGSRAIVGQFDMALLDKTDADGITLYEALVSAGHPPENISAIARNPNDILGFVEVHIEQGPVLLQQDMPVGIVTSIAGNSRYMITLTGMAGHAGTTPMPMRKDAAAAAAEIVLLVEYRCSQAASLVGTVGQLQVPGGSVNVIPAACSLSLDIRAADDVTRMSAVADILAGINAICTRRGIGFTVEETLSISATPCAPWLMRQLTAAAENKGIPGLALTSGAGHDAMMMAAITDVAMLFTRCGNGGISHHPLETMTADDGEASALIFLEFLRKFQSE